MSEQQSYQQDKLHEKLIELLWKIKGMGKIGDVIIRSVKETVSPNERILTCFYHLDLSEQMKSKDAQPTFYSCEIHLVTTMNYIVLGFYPNFHSAHIKQIDHISELRIENRFVTGFDEEEKTAEDKDYEPINVIFTVAFANKNGDRVCEWNAEASRKETLVLLQEQARVLEKIVGQPLSSIS